MVGSCRWHTINIPDVLDSPLACKRRRPAEPMNREQGQALGQMLRMPTRDRGQIPRAREQRPDPTEPKRSYSRRLDVLDNASIDAPYLRSW
jgi:hypothetical protein